MEKTKSQMVYCCKQFQYATLPSTSTTDNDEPLFWRWDREPNTWLVGSGLANPKFCPWCGKELKGALSHG